MIILIIFSLLFLIYVETLKQSLGDYPINTYIGTGGFGWGTGSNPLTAQTPYGMARVGPDTSNKYKVWLDFEHCGGYYYADTFINMFSHLHLVGAGVVDYGWLGVIPISINSSKDVGQQVYKLANKKYGFRSKFSHDNEQTEPGYYKVSLETHNIDAEITASDHVGVHRYTFNNDSSFKNVIVFPISYTLAPNVCKDSLIEILPDQQVLQGWEFCEGSLSGRFGGLKPFFYSKIENKFIEYGVYDENGVYPGETQAQGCQAGAYIVINEKQAMFSYGISFVSIENAYKNIQLETQFKNFDLVKETNQNAWLLELSRFEIETNDQDTEIQYWTAIYTSHLSPTKWSEANGQYLGFDLTVQNKPQNMEFVYTDMSLWDVHRSQYPFILFHDAPRQMDVTASLMLIYEQADYLPKWPLGPGWTGCMIGSNSDIVIADQIVKNEFTSQKLNINQVKEAFNKLANTEQPHDSRWDPEVYIKKQYVVQDMNGGSQSASKTLSYNYDDWCISQVFNYTGDIETANIYYERSQWYKNIWDTEAKFFCNKYENGEIKCPEGVQLLNYFNDQYTEGDAWHWRFFLPGDPKGLIDLFGGNEEFVKELEIFASKAKDFPTDYLPNPYYWAGNEEDLFSLMLFAYAERPDLTQKYVRWVLDQCYNSKHDGLPGNDDFGTMSAWYAFTSLGLYPRPGGTEYIVTSPVFEKASIKRLTIDGGICNFVMETKNLSEKNIYIDYIEINGEKIDSYPFLDHNTQLKCQPDQDSIYLTYYMTNESSK